MIRGEARSLLSTSSKLPFPTPSAAQNDFLTDSASSHLFPPALFSLASTLLVYCLFVQSTSFSVIVPASLSISTMEEIAPEYDVVVLGTGMLLPRRRPSAAVVLC